MQDKKVIKTITEVSYQGIDTKEGYIFIRRWIGGLGHSAVGVYFIMTHSGGRHVSEKELKTFNLNGSTLLNSNDWDEALKTWVDSHNNKVIARGLTPDEKLSVEKLYPKLVDNAHKGFSFRQMDARIEFLLSVIGLASLELEGLRESKGKKKVKEKSKMYL